MRRYDRTARVMVIAFVVILAIAAAEWLLRRAG